MGFPTRVELHLFLLGWHYPEHVNLPSVLHQCRHDILLSPVPPFRLTRYPHTREFRS